MFEKMRAATMPTQRKAETAVVFLFQDTKVLPMALRDLDRTCGLVMAQGIGREEIQCKLGQTYWLYPESEYTRVLLVGLGKTEEPRQEALRIAGSALQKILREASQTSVELYLDAALATLDDVETSAQSVGEAMGLANFVFNAFKGRSSEPAEKKKRSLTVYVDRTLREGFNRGLKIAESVNVARTLAATPPNIANPIYLARFCRLMAKQVGLKCQIIDKKKAQDLKLGGLLAVGEAGSTPPVMISLEHKPKGVSDSLAPILLVGKAVTFDTGGYSLKNAAGMESMKYDKCGGMAVIGAMHAIATLDLPIHVVGLIPCAENMVDASAYRPSDIITLANGVTVEVTNTDAEGRLVLGDALAYGTAKYKPRAVVDLATLTGGVVVTLGSLCAGCFCNDQAFRSKLFDAAEKTGERLWHLPLWNEHRKMLKSTHADIVNSAGREAHPSQGAAFLSYFVGKNAPKKLPALPWAHLDIAGMADVKKDTPLYTKGPTGFGVRLLVDLLENWS